MMLLNALLGTLVAVVGFWLVGRDLSSIVLTGLILSVGGFLWWRARSLTEVWAWTTLLLGLESLAWPLTLMIQLKRASEIPSDEEMGTILSAVVLGLFSSVFWISFSYGLFKRAWQPEPSSSKSLGSQNLPQPPKR